MYVNGKDLRHRHLSERRDILEQVVSSNRVLLLSHRLAQNGLEAYKVAKRAGYEGLVAKDLSSHYVEKRSRLWLKVKVHQEDEFIIAGFTAPAGSRKYFGALLLGAYEKGKLRYVGRVGTGFGYKTLASLYKKFQPLIRKKPVFVDPPRERNVTFLKPKLVAQITFSKFGMRICFDGHANPYSVRKARVA